MTFEIEKVFESLEKTLENLNGLLSVTQKQQAALVSSDLAGLNEIILEQEKILMELQKAEEKRIQEFDKIAKAYNLMLENYRIGDFVEKIIKFVDNETAEKLLQYGFAIKEKAQKISEINKTNSELIAKSKTILNDIVQKLFDKEKPIIDMRF